VVLRPPARPRDYLAAEVLAVLVVMYAVEVGKPLQTYVEVGRFAPGQAGGSYNFNPFKDRDVYFFCNSFAADGTPAFSSIEDAFAATARLLVHQRETEAPVVGQNSPATADQVEIGIAGFTRFARQRRITISANSDMSSPLAVLLFDSANYTERELPRYLTLSRTFAGDLQTEDGLRLETEDGLQLSTEAGTVLPLTVYLTVAHSGGGVYWTPESSVLPVTFAAGTGLGGSTGNFDPTPRDKHNLDYL
jgi:hypothetical protein